MTFDILSKKFEERYQFFVKSVKYENLENGSTERQTKAMVAGDNLKRFSGKTQELVYFCKPGVE